MDKDIFNMDEIDDLMSNMFDADASVSDMVEAVSVKLDKMDGSLELFMEDEKARAERWEQYEEDPYSNTVDGVHTAPQYQSAFGGGTIQHNLSNQYVNENDIAFDKDEQNSSLAGVQTVTGIEDIHDFFAVGREQTFDDESINIDEIDEQMEEMRNMSSEKQRELDQEFVNAMGMDIQRLRKIAGATSAWQEIRAIKKMLDDMELEAKRTRHRFEEFIDIYVKQHIPR